MGINRGIFGVTQNRAADVRHLDADLMMPSGVKGDFGKSEGFLGA